MVPEGPGRGLGTREGTAAAAPGAVVKEPLVSLLQALAAV